MIAEYLPIFLVFFVAILFAGGTVISSKLFGPQRPTPEKISPYESGMKPLGGIRDRVSIKYYLVAMLFIIFDIEVIFVYPWAVEFKQLFLDFGIIAFVPMLVFLIVLELGFLYVYKKGGLKWD